MGTIQVEYKRGEYNILKACAIPILDDHQGSQPQNDNILYLPQLTKALTVRTFALE